MSPHANPVMAACFQSWEIGGPSGQSASAGARATIAGVDVKYSQRRKRSSNPKTGAFGGAPRHLSLGATRARARIQTELP
jgi:hypothetical protein